MGQFADQPCNDLLTMIIPGILMGTLLFPQPKVFGVMRS